MSDDPLDYTTSAIDAMRLVKSTFRNDGLRRSSIKCPRCGGSLQYAIDPRNDHSRAACRTENCLSWIE